MKALSIRQPGVWAILRGGKAVDQRSWTSKHRGWLALHACARSATAYELPRGVRSPDLAALDYSAVCGLARLVDVTPAESSSSRGRGNGSTRYDWMLADVTPLPDPIACKGRRRLWTVPPSVVRKIRRQLPKLDLRES